MSTIAETIQAVLMPLATGGAFQTVAAQNTVAPFIVWIEVGTTTNNNLQGASALQNIRIQVDCFSKTQAGLAALSAAVIAAMAGASFSSVHLSSQNLYEQEVKLFRTAHDFSIWTTG